MPSERRLYTEDHAKIVTPGKPYRPSNGTEGEMFYARWCEDCKHDAEYRKTQENGCKILAATMLFSTDDAEYPKEWTHDENGQPCCMAFEEVRDA